MQDHVIPQVKQEVHNTTRVTEYYSVLKNKQTKQNMISTLLLFIAEHVLQGHT